MKTVSEGNLNVSKLLGKQRLKNVEYRKMKYLLQSECDEGILLHNVITGKLVLLEGTESLILQTLPCACSEEIAALIEDYFLVPINYDEYVTVNQLRLLMKKIFASGGINGYTILPTTSCNARCFYCYQSEYSHINMSEETANRVVDFMVEHKGTKPLHISWFGGEPLVGIDRINQICSELKNRDVDYTSSMISNGYLFTESIVESANELWRLKSVQITLDGTEAIYNQTKAYVAVSGSPYYRVLDNIELLLSKGIRVNVRLNLDQHNRNDLQELIEYLMERFGKFKRFDAYVHVLYENEGYEPIKRDQESRKSLAELQTQLNSIILEKGRGRYHRVLPQIKLHSCMADSMNSLVVFPNGQLYKCEHVMPGDEVGNIESGVVVTNNIEKFQKPIELRTCSDCSLLPSCYLLKECEGVLERNPEKCKFDVDSRTLALVDHYNYWKDKKKNSDKNLLDITDLEC